VKEEEGANAWGENPCAIRIVIPRGNFIFQLFRCTDRWMVLSEDIVSALQVMYGGDVGWGEWPNSHKTGFKLAD
jgi:hypothetical protein